MRPVVRFTDTTDGSFSLNESDAELLARRERITEHPVTWLRQVHGARVVMVTHPGEGAGTQADAAVTTVPAAALGVITADCAPVIFTSPVGVAAAHAGWRGLVAGVLDQTIQALRNAGAADITAYLGPCIRPRCYEFGTEDLDVVAATFGDEVRAVTSVGTPALDVAAAVRIGLARAGVDAFIDSGICTACSPVHWSHRARGDAGRQGAFVWLGA